MIGGATDARRLMDGIYRNQRHIYDVTRRYYLLGRLHLVDQLAPPPQGHVLEIGCGTAWNLIRAARRYPQASFHGLDVSSEMLRSAKQAVARQGLGHRITLHLADATTFEPAKLTGIGTFDRIYLSYTLSMVPEWRGVLQAAASHLAPGGSLHVVDFGRCEALPGFFRSALHAWLARFHVTPRDDLERALAVVASARGDGVTFAALYRGYASYGELRRA